MQVTNHSNNKRKMKEELLEAIYGTVERLEQKVDELSVSTKNAGAETVPASNDITKLDKSWLITISTMWHGLRIVCISIYGTICV